MLVSGTFKGTPEGVRDALSALRLGLAETCQRSDAIDTAELVVAEALNNVVEHAVANRSDPTFELMLSKSNDGIDVEIRDRGIAMPDEQLPAGNLPDIDVQLADLPEGGFGWFLIRQLTDDLAYARKDDENHLTFRLAFED